MIKKRNTAPIRAHAPRGVNTMRVVDMSRHTIIKCGVDWPFDATPNCKRMISQLERNEALVTWLQPSDGAVKDQFPAIRIRDSYYTMSLRMMKAVWRHVRLKKNFINREIVPHVGVKLRIPEVLLVEKMRTQQRFNVGDALLFCARAYFNAARPRRSCGRRRTVGPTRRSFASAWTRSSPSAYSRRRARTR